MPDLPPPTPEEIARWRELDRLATKGPWVNCEEAGEDGPYLVHYETDGGWIHVGRFDYGKDGNCLDNRALIAEYRTAVPRLLDRVKELEAARAVHRFGRKAR